MKKNIGFVGRGARGLIGIVFVFVAAKNYFSSSTASFLFFLVGLILIIESMLGFCLLKKIFKKKSATIKQNADEMQMPPRS